MGASAVAVGGALISASASKSAAGKAASSAERAGEIQAQAALAGVEEQRRQFDVIQGTQKPFLQTGYASLDALSDMLGLPPRGGTQYGPTDFGPAGAAGGGQRTLDEITSSLRSQFTTRGSRQEGLGPYSRWQTEAQIADEPSSYGDYVKAGGRPFGGSTRQGGRTTVDEAGLAEEAQRVFAAQGGGGAGAGGAGAARTPYDWQTSPAYEFRLNEGLRALNRGAGRMGQRLSGNRLLGLQEYGQQSAAQEFGAQFARVGTLAGFGPAAANVTSQAGLATSGNISNLLAGAGAARGAGAAQAGQYQAAGTLGLGSAIGQGFNAFSQAGGFGGLGGGGSGGGRVQSLDQAFGPGGYLSNV